jgi:hypothetical protein
LTNTSSKGTLNDTKNRYKISNFSTGKSNYKGVYFDEDKDEHIDVYINPPKNIPLSPITR